MKYKLGTISVQGAYHDLNQDYAMVKQSEIGIVMALADGLGSLNFSQFGARFFCECAIDIVERMNYQINNDYEFLKVLHNQWIDMIRMNGLVISDCYCTALLIIITGNRCKAFHLGDGIMSIKADDEFIVSIEGKEDDFANYTEPLTERLEFEKWEIYSFNFNNLQGIYLSSDGVELIDTSEKVVKQFLNDFIDGYEDMSSYEIESDIKGWLIDWPSSDDKTIAYLLREEPSDE